MNFSPPYFRQFNILFKDTLYNWTTSSNSHTNINQPVPSNYIYYLTKLFIYKIRTKSTRNFSDLKIVTYWKTLKISSFHWTSRMVRVGELSFSTNAIFNWMLFSYFCECSIKKLNLVPYLNLIMLRNMLSWKCESQNKFEEEN